MSIGKRCCGGLVIRTEVRVTDMGLVTRTLVRFFLLIVRTEVRVTDMGFVTRTLVCFFADRTD